MTLGAVEGFSTGPETGSPLPGTYLLDEAGIVTNEFFHRNLAARESAQMLLMPKFRAAALRFHGIALDN